jgi:hypothetical protein
MLGAGTLCASVFAAGLLATEEAPDGYVQLVIKDLPVLLVAAAVGFGTGMLGVLLWSALLRLLAPSTPRP